MSSFSSRLKYCLTQHRLPASYISRTVLEFEDHFLHLVEDATARGLTPEQAEREAAAELGDPRQLADTLALSYKASRSPWRQVLANLWLDRGALTLRLIGAYSVLCATLGLFFTWSCMPGVLARHAAKGSTPDAFLPAYFTMTGISTVILALLLVTGIRIFRQQRSALTVFTIASVLPIVMIFLTGAAWLSPSLGLSIAAATGVSQMGLTLFVITLFPLWAPLAAVWALRREKTLSE